MSYHSKQQSRHARIRNAKRAARQERAAARLAAVTTTTVVVVPSTNPNTRARDAKGRFLKRAATVG